MGDYWIIGVIYSASAILRLACKVVVLAVVLGAVRRHRPDAYKPLLAWAVTGLVAGVLVSVVSYLGPVAASMFGTPGNPIIFVQAVNAGLGVAFDVVLTLLLAHGLVQLARPPKPLVVETDPPYR